MACRFPKDERTNAQHDLRMSLLTARLPIADCENDQRKIRMSFIVRPAAQDTGLDSLGGVTASWPWVVGSSTLGGQTVIPIMPRLKIHHPDAGCAATASASLVVTRGINDTATTEISMPMPA